MQVVCCSGTRSRAASTSGLPLDDRQIESVAMSSSDGLDASLRVELPRVSDVRGNLTFIEGSTHLPFPISRVYYLYDVPFGAERGGHAHRRLQQAVVALTGRFLLRLHDGSSWREFDMMDPGQAVLIPPMTWRELVQFSSGAVCLVLASRPYEEEDYIRDFATFISEAEG